MKRLTLQFLGVLACLAATAAWPADLVEGKDYSRLKNPQAVETGKKIEVIEFFSYGCPHCNDLEPVLQKWMKTLPPDVQFRRVPVIFQQRWEGLARIYYPLDALCVEERLSPEVFKAVHVSGMSMYEDKTFFDWAANHGLDRARVAEIYNSFAVNSKYNRAKALAQAYNIQSVPTIIVDGKFVTASDRVGTHEQLPPVLDALIVKARAERAKT
jgi:thiol:disulfide interchange protein DsbA